MNLEMITTTFHIPGNRIVKQLGVVRGITVRSPGFGGSIVGGLQSLFRGRVEQFTELCEMARAEAFKLMVEHAVSMGANAIVGFRYDANEVMSNVTEVLAYGTAVWVELED